MTISKSFTLAQAVCTAILVLAVGGCKTSSFGEKVVSGEAARSDGLEISSSPKLYLMPTKNEFCQIGPKNTLYFQNYIYEQRNNKKVSGPDGDTSNLSARLKAKEAIELCNVEIEDWILKSLALGKPAPYEVAGIREFMGSVPWGGVKAAAACVAVLETGHPHITSMAAIIAITADYIGSKCSK